MNSPVLVIPGIGNSGPAHWQSLWQSARPHWQRLQVPDWDQVACTDWVSAIERQAAALGNGVVLVAHSLGCLAVAHWAARHASTDTSVVRGALLVAVPDHAAPAFPASAVSGFLPLPSVRLAFPTIVVASTDDPYGSVAHARACATAWGSEFVEIGARGHINGDSVLGDWPEGYRLLEKLG